MMDQSKPNNSGLEVFQAFSEIEMLGMERLQQLCDAWLETLLAKEFAVSKLSVNDSDGRPLLTFESQLTHNIDNDREYYFPMDELLSFIAENGIPDPSERNLVISKIRAARQKSGPNVYRLFQINPGPKVPLFLTCPNCGEVLQTQYLEYRNVKSEVDGGEADCPVCNHIFTFGGSDLHYEPED